MSRGKATRDQIVEQADRLFYRQGYEHTSFADIAGAVKISRGNFYHHFKCKDDILDAVINRRLVETGKMLEQWESSGPTPADRIRSFIHILIANLVDIKRYGCPVGTLSTELAKQNHVAQPKANMLFTLYRTWLRRQFILLGRESDADILAMHLLARSQGIATLTNAFQDEEFIRHEVRLMEEWLDSVTTAAEQPRRNTRDTRERTAH